LETENIATASANVLVTPEWLWENLGKDRVLDSPRPLALDLNLHEDSILEGVRYLGVSNLSAGFEITYLTGRFTHDPIYLQPDYHQTSFDVAADYAVSRLSSFNGTLGYTRRSDSVGDDLSGLTGSLGYKRNLTGKTTFTAKISRAVNSYISTEGSEVDTSAALTLNYQLTYKTSFNAGYSWMESKFPQYTPVNPFTDAPIPGAPTDEDRVDHIQYASLEANYLATRWLSLRAYGRYQTRHSNQEVNTYNVTIYGIELLAKLPQ
jgi:Putative beta-barrel porin 2